MKARTLGLGLFASTAAFVPACASVLDTSSYKISDDNANAECTVNADCSDKGDNYICRKSDGQCVSLVESDCSRVVGDYQNDNAIIFGSLLPNAGPDQSSGLPLQNAIELAIDDFRSVGSVAPAPGMSERRPLVLVECNDGGNEETALRGARHLVETVGVPAIIGAAYSGITISVATQVTIPGETLLISPSATSVAITTLADNGLVWRTSPSDVIQADASVALFPLIEEQLKEQNSISRVKVAIAHKGDAYGSGLAQALTQKLVINDALAIDAANEPYFKVVNYGDPDDEARQPDYPAVVSSIVDMAPNAVFLFGTTETVTELLSGIEAQWKNGSRPFYIMADGSVISDLATYLEQNDPTDDVRKRILGTAPGTTSQSFRSFRVLYQSKINDGTSADTAGAANAYDALYNLAYAAVAIGDKPLTGLNLKDGFAKLVPPGAALDVGAQQINSAFQTLSAGESIDFNGASGPLDYDLTTGEAVSDIQIWCVASVDGRPSVGYQSTIYYDSVAQALQGTWNAAATTCGF